MADQKIIFSMSGVNKVFPPSKQVLKNIYLSFFYGAKIGVLGLNGSGKSSLLRIIAGLDKEYEGEVVSDLKFSVGFLEQDPKLDKDKTVQENVEQGVKETKDLLNEFEAINERFGDAEILSNPDKMEKLISKQADIQEKIDALDGWELDHRLQRAMDALRCPPPNSKVNYLSGGEKRRVALCRLLLQAPDVLLLDEPTNHLDAESVLWLEEHLRQYEGTIIAVTHDRYFLDNISGWILELDRGQGIPWKGNYSSWLEQKQKRLSQEDKSQSKKQKALERELEWVRMNPKGRRSKGKARLNAYDKMIGQEKQEREDKIELYIPPGPRLGNKVIEVDGVSKSFGETLLFENLSFSLPPAGIIGIIGPNGAGKTTLFKMIVGTEKPDTGTFSVGETVKIAYFDQEHDSLNPENTVFQAITGGDDLILLGGKEVNSRAYVSKFNFSGIDQQKKVKELSGGMRNRTHLAIALKQGGNLLLLDEPTNDLDVNTLRTLEEALENFGGCAVIISHDRWFLDRVCTHILAFEGNSQVYWFEGGFSEYEENKRKRMGKEQPSRIKYKKLLK